jgi:FMN phosphatase YigB (HAD superfamily)
MNRDSETEIKQILFDTGGVLTCDVWETLLLTPVSGLADRLGLDHQIVRRAAEVLWKQYATRSADEADYWQDLEAALSVRIPSSEILTVEQELLKANKDIPQVLRLAAELGFDMGIISNTTSFWFGKQMSIAQVNSRVKKDLIFVSYEYGSLKEDSKNSLFSIAAERVHVHSTLVIDDRQLNTSIAKSYGFKAVIYNMNSCENSLSSVIARIFEDKT